MKKTMSKKIFTIKNLQHGRTREVIGDSIHTLDHVWASEKCWYGKGDRVEISDEEGNSQVFVK